ncbi:hypothetical protein [Streptomyces sp. NPDC048385]|uniref:hypothetical protein n=1 Tax=Streptomyces sp. NPDC048385 TaxID=3155145 RepID=UPI0034233861
MPPHRAVIDAATTSSSEYLGSAGRHLRLLLDGECMPEAVEFDPASLIAAFPR